jgi:hypothetical protein
MFFFAKIFPFCKGLNDEREQTIIATVEERQTRLAKKPFSNKENCQGLSVGKYLMAHDTLCSIGGNLPSRSFSAFQSTVLLVRS